MYQTRHSGASVGERGFITLHEVSKNEANGELSAVSQHTTTADFWRPTTTLSLSLSDTSWKHSPDVPRHCWQDGRVSTSSHTDDWQVFARRLRWSWLPGKTTHHQGLCGDVLDKVWIQVWRDTAPCSHPYSTGRLRWKMCRRNDFTFTTTHFVLSQSYFRQSCHRKLTSPCTHVIHGYGTYRKSRPLRRRFARPLPWRIIEFLVQVEESERCFWLGTWTGRDVHRIARKCARTSGRCNVLGQKYVHPQPSASRPECYSSRDHTRPLRLSFPLATILTMNARRFQRTHHLSGMGSSLNATKDIGTGVSGFALTCGSEPVVGAVCTAVVGSCRIWSLT